MQRGKPGSRFIMRSGHMSLRPPYRVRSWPEVRYCLLGFGLTGTLVASYLRCYFEATLGAAIGKRYRPPKATRRRVEVRTECPKRWRGRSSNQLFLVVISAGPGLAVHPVGQLVCF